MQGILNKQVSLITSSKIRYEGLLTHVDGQNKLLTVQDVVCKGTEGRNQGTNEVPPMGDNIAPYKVI